jgi:hypothetical protein
MILRKYNGIQENIDKKFNEIGQTIHSMNEKFSKDIEMIEKN